eukprot:3355356-Rhodomonas_salina.2
MPSLPKETRQRQSLQQEKTRTQKPPQHKHTKPEEKDTNLAGLEAEDCAHLDAGAKPAVEAAEHALEGPCREQQRAPPVPHRAPRRRRERVGRQLARIPLAHQPPARRRRQRVARQLAPQVGVGQLAPVSYTHLTLPTICSV